MTDDTTNDPAARQTAIASRAAGMPIAVWLNYQASVIDGTLIHRLGFDEKHIGNPIIRALHGGVIAAFLELSAQLEVEMLIEPGQRAKVISTQIDYLASSVAADMEAAVSVKKLGRRIAFLDATGWQSDRLTPVAQAQLCFRIGA
ncbi:MAG: PaaI family thioesterase [Pseudomonadota bacterium]